MITLALDASTYVGDVAVLDGGRVLAEASVAMKGADEERLMPAVANVLQLARQPVSAIDRVVCGEGPGSFTSLRIAGSIAKGIASGLGRPLFAVSSMALIVGGAELPVGRYLAAIDALRSEFYVALYDIEPSGSLVGVEPPRLIPANDLERIAEQFEARIISPSPIVLEGRGSRVEGRASNVESRGAGSITASPRARAVSKLESVLSERGPADIAGWEPSYGRLAEAQVRWEATHGRALPAR